MDTTELWPLLVVNFPLVAAFFLALTKKWLYTGTNVKDIESSYEREIQRLEKELVFREQLRQEALADRAILAEKDREKTEALRELTDVVKQTLQLNDRLLNETLGQRWDGNDRRENRSGSNTR